MAKHSDRAPIPPPAKRHEPLPSQFPKHPAEDPDAPARIKAILGNPASRRADLDLDFLAEDPVRGIRLQIDYLKPELLLEEHGIGNTIVVFGSTRICEPAAARRIADTLKAALSDDPADKELAHRLAIAERIVAKSQYYDVAREFARLVSTANQTGKGPHCTVVTGGGPGIMEAANRGAFDAGAETVGFNISLPHEQYPNPYITPGLGFNFRYFAIRKLHFLLRAKALVACPGGIRHLRRVVRGAHAGSDTHGATDADRVGWRILLAPRRGYGFPDRGRRHCAGRPRIVLVYRDCPGNLGRHLALVRQERHATSRGVSRAF